MRNILDEVRRKDLQAVKTDAQVIYRTRNRPASRDAFARFKQRWVAHYPSVVKQLEKDLPELLAFFSFHPTLWRKLGTHQHHRTGFRGGTEAYAADGLLRARGQRRPDYLFHLSEVQS